MKPIEGYEGYFIDETADVYSNKYGDLRKLKPRKIKGGYLQVKLCKDGERNHLVIHRLVYQAFVGKIPEGMEIDHIDRNPSNNKLDNLRLVTHQQNMFNIYGKGYYLNKVSNKWQAQIRLNYKRIHIGMFDTEAEARAAYLQAKEKLHII